VFALEIVDDRAKCVEAPLRDGVLVVAGFEDDPVRFADGVGEISQDVDLVGGGASADIVVMFQTGRVGPGSLGQLANDALDPGW